MENFRAYSIKPVLPWDHDTDQDKRYRLIIILFLFLGIVLGILVANLPYTQRSQTSKEKIPERLANVLMRKKEVKPPPPPPVEKKQLKVEEEKIKPPEEKRKPPPPKDETERKAREAAQKKLDEAKSVLADLQNIKLDLNTKPLAKGGAQAKQADRKLITSRATSGSGGIQVASNVSASDSSGFGGSGGKELVGMATTQVESGIGSGAGSSGSRAKGGDGYRTSEEIRKVFDAQKGILFSLYQRALRQNPNLQGTILLNLVIAPSGVVTKCEVISTEITDEDLVRKIVARVKTFNFGADDVDTWSGKYPIHLVPS